MSVPFLASISPAESKPPNDIENLLANPDAWDEIGEEYHDELDVIKAEIFWRRTIRKKFIHKTDEAQPPVIAPAPLPSIPGTLLAPTLAAQIMVDKYEDHLPHYRQSQRFRRRHDIDIGRQTLNAWTHATARHLAPIDRAIREEILRASELQIDETPTRLPRSRPRIHPRRSPLGLSRYHELTFRT